MKTRSKKPNTTRNNTTNNNNNNENIRRLRNRVMKIRSTRKSLRLQSLGPIIDLNKPSAASPTINRSASTSPVKRSTPKSSPTKRSTPNSSPIKRKSKPKEQPVRSDVCNFCFTSSSDNHLLGELKTLDDITAHKFCLYFSPGLSQNGEPNEGLWGFIPDDIRKELRRGVLLKCSYCKEKGAVVGCSIPECVITFHLPCGMQNGAFMHYHQEQHLYPSYCKRHRPKLQVPSFKRRILCTICQEYMKNCDRDNLLYINCCQSYFHRECLIKVAYHQGEFNLKCPNCNNNEEFVSTIKKGGIYVPYRDPTWEITGEVSLNHVEFQCSAANCQCQQGRNYNGDDEWELFSCDRCGSNAIHVSCAGFHGENNIEWFCDICRNI